MKTKNAPISPGNNIPVVVEEICYHKPQDRVRTHRGYHCNNCGERF